MIKGTNSSQGKKVIQVDQTYNQDPICNQDNNCNPDPIYNPDPICNQDNNCNPDPIYNQDQTFSQDRIFSHDRINHLLTGIKFSWTVSIISLTLILRKSPNKFIKNRNLNCLKSQN
jgi:hypothetical protein